MEIERETETRHNGLDIRQYIILNKTLKKYEFLKVILQIQDKN